MKITSKYSQLLAELDRQPCIDWIETVRGIGLDPATFFEGSDWTGTDFSMSDMRGISFRNAILDETRFRAGDLSKRVRKEAISTRGLAEVKDEWFPASYIASNQLAQARRLLEREDNLIIVGERGFGKSVLLGQLATQAATRKSRVFKLTGQGCLDQLYLRLAGRRGRSADGVSAEVEGPFAARSKEARYRLYKQLILRLRSLGNVFLVIDDLHLASPPELRFLYRLTRRARVRYIAAGMLSRSDIDKCFRRYDQTPPMYRLSPLSQYDIDLLLARYPINSGDQRAMIAAALEGLSYRAIAQVMSRMRKYPIQFAIADYFEDLLESAVRPALDLYSSANRGVAKLFTTLCHKDPKGVSFKQLLRTSGVSAPVAGDFIEQLRLAGVASWSEDDVVKVSNVFCEWWLNSKQRYR